MFKTLKKNLFRSPYQSLSAILVVSLAFFVINIFFLIGAGSGVALKFFESRPQVLAYLKDEATVGDINSLKIKLQGNGEIKNIVFVSKEDALNIYKGLFKDKPILLEMVTAKFLPASLEVSANNISSLKPVADLLKKEKIVEDVDFQEDVVSTLSGWLGSLRKFGFFLAGFLFIISVLTILTVLGMKISQRKEEIEILKLLGASSWNICSPFYLEGMCYGIIAAVISWSLSYLLILYSSPFLTNFLSGTPVFPVPIIFMAEVLGGQIVLGVVVGFIGSFLTVSRFMRSSR